MSQETIAARLPGSAPGDLTGVQRPLDANLREGFLALAGNTTLPKAVREVVILSVGAASGAQYELYSHEVRARDAGLGEDKIRAIAAGQRPPDLSG